MPEPVPTDTGTTSGGALDELARDPLARRKFLTMSGKSIGGAAAAGSLGLFLAACGDDKKAAAPAMTTTEKMAAAGGDLAIVNYALTLEYIETDFYNAVLETDFFKGSTLATLKSFGEQEQTHVDALLKVAKSLGTPAEKPKTTFPLEDAKQVAELAATVENLGASAYLGAAGSIKSMEILAAALAIHSIEARHAAVLNTLTNQSVTPDGAFAKPTAMADVLAAVQPFLVAA